jgi:hypothetical protein
MAKRGKRARKQQVSSSSSESAVSSGPEEGDRWDTESEDEADTYCLYCAGLFSEDRGDEEWIRCQKCQSGHTLFVQTVRQEHLCVTGASNDRNVFTLISKYVTNNFYFVVLSNKRLFWLS